MTALTCIVVSVDETRYHSAVLLSHPSSNMVRLHLSPSNKLADEALPRYWQTTVGWLLVNHVIHFVNTLTNICVLVIFIPGKYAVF